LRSWSSTCGAAQQTTPPPPPILQEPQTILLWPRRRAGAQAPRIATSRRSRSTCRRNTTGPMTAVIVAPGGSYRALASNLEGRAPANYFNTLGVAAFVLRYRLGPQYHHPIQLGDAQRAIRTVRARPQNGTSRRTGLASWASRLEGISRRACRPISTTATRMRPTRSIA
jgi:acetyl esterase/lipase